MVKNRQGSEADRLRTSHQHAKAVLFQRFPPSNAAEIRSLLLPAFEGVHPGGSFTAKRYPEIHCALDFVFRNGTEGAEAAAAADTYLMTKLCKTSFFI